MSITAVGVDPGVNHVGLALIVLGGKYARQCSTWKLDPEHLADALARIAAALAQLSIPDVTGVEYVAKVQNAQTLKGKNSFAATEIREAAGGAWGAACALRMNPVWVAPYDWRSQLGVRHNAPKKVVRAAVAQRFDDVGGKSEHEVDAIAIALAAATRERLRSCSPKLERLCKRKSWRHI